MTITNMPLQLEPGQWSLVTARSRLVHLHVKKQASLRLHLFASPEVNAPPPVNTSDYTVVQNHLPTAPVMEPYRHDPTVFLMPDGDEPVSAIASIQQPDPDDLVINPPCGKLNDGKVGIAYSAPQLWLYGWSTTFEVRAQNGDKVVALCDFDIVEGQLPPGLFLETDQPDRNEHDGFGPKASIKGTPTKAGEYFFTLRASISPDWSDDTPEIARGVYSITIGAPT